MTTELGGPASHISVGKVAHGLMLMTWTPEPVPDEQCFEAIQASIGSVPAGSKMILNSGEFYGIEPSTANLELVSRFFTKYPDLADRAFLSVKGGLEANSRQPNSSEANLRRSVDLILEKLAGKKRVDLFQCARVDKRVPIETAIGTLSQLIKEGKFDYIGLSECSSDTLRRAHAVHPITMVEIEISPWSYEDETKKVIATAGELGITVLGYSPLGRGFLTGAIKSNQDVTGFRQHMPRFQDEAMKHNFALVDSLGAIAQKKGITAAQLCIAWVAALGPHVIPLPGSSHVKRTLENIAGGDATLTSSDLEEINKVLANHEVQGARSAAAGASHLWG